MDPNERLPGLGLTDTQEAEVERIVSDMRFEDLAAQLAGSRGWSALTPWTYRTSSYPAGGSPRHGFGPLRFTDGPRGINLGHSTCFPSASTRGATWDPELERQVGDAMGIEARAQGANAVGSTCVNLIRHPGWGRAQESFGADPHHVGAMGAAHVHGLRNHVVPVVKHFALNSIENSRFRVNVEVDPATLHEIYLPQFRACLRAGASGVMTAYNKINGTYCGQSDALFAVLREQWGFDGFVMSDFFLGCRSARASLRAGLDLEMPQAWRYHRFQLERLRRRGDIDVERIRNAARRILRARAAHGVLHHEERPAVAEAAHQQLALEASRASIVVARNRHDILPLRHTDRIGVVGPLARVASLGSEGSVSVAPPFSVSPLEGLRSICRHVTYEPRLRPAAVSRLARHVDVVVMVIGSGPRDEGEYFPLLGGGDRRSLAIHADQVAAVSAAIEAGRPTVVVWVGGGLPSLGAWEAQVPCLLFAGHGGMQGGRALAEVLTGQAVASGHLSACVPRDDDDLAPFDPDANHVVYDRWFDYRRFDRSGERALFNLGHGSAQTELVTEAAVLAAESLGADDHVEARLALRNQGSANAMPLVTLFIGYQGEDDTRELRSLRGFTKARVDAGASRELSVRVPVAELAIFDESSERWKLRQGQYVVWSALCGGEPVELGEVTVRT